MHDRARPCPLPAGSRMAALIEGSSFHDSWVICTRERSTAEGTPCPALEYFIQAARNTPAWVDHCMQLRNLLGGLVGLKDLGRLSALVADKPASAYRNGERIGIFCVIDNHVDEALLGDDDKHLKVMLGIHRQPGPAHGQVQVTITTVVHVKNLLGHLYMLPVTPAHRLVTPAVLTALANQPAPAS